jgi:hypothetical protein
MQAQGHPPVHLPTDWSHRHLLFSPPTSMAQAWKLQTEPRYWHQWYRHHAADRQSTDSRPKEPEPDGDNDGEDEEDRDPHGSHKHRNQLHPDWSMSLSVAGTAGDEMFPAKFSFDVNATPSCANDFVAFNSSVTPGAKDASATGDFSNSTATNGQTAIITNGGSSETLTASGAPSTGTITVSSVPNAGDTVTVGATTYTFDTSATGTITLSSVPNVADTVTVGLSVYTFVTTLVLPNDVLIVSGNANSTASNLRAAINANSGQCSASPCFGTGTTANASVTATRASNVVTVTAKTSGTGGNVIVFTTVSGGRITLSPNTGTLSGGAGGTLSTANEVLAVTGSTANTAQNLRAAIDANAGQCFASPCFGTGTAANASVTAAVSGSVVTVTDKTYGTAGNSVTFTTASGGRLTLSPNTGTLSGGVTGVNTGTNFALDGNSNDAATNLAAAIIRNNAGVGVTATSNGTVVTVTATTAGSAGNNITVGGTLSSFWSSTTLIGGVDAQPSIIAFNQLYSTQGSTGGLCNQNGPSVMWSYNTNPSGDTTGTNVTSVVLSLDGKKVAYVETRTNGNGGSILHILQWKASQGTLTTPVAPDQIVTAWGSCTAGNSCIVNKTFGNAQPDSNSAPFYNYTTDILYVGDDNGSLHKFTPVFSGTPAEVTTGGWPITVDSGTALSSPVFDGGSGNIFVGDAGGRLSYVREVGSTVGTCSSGSPPCLGSTTVTLSGATIVDAPIVDSSAGKVFLFGNDTTNGGTVEQVNTALGSSVTVNVGVSAGNGPASVLHSGAFDNAYLSGSFSTGHIFVCGKNLVNADRPAIHRIGFNSSGVMNSTSDGNLVLVNSSGEECSPVTEILNGATDRIFFSVANNANQTGCTGNAGCIMSIDLGGAWPPAAVTHGVAASGGTSGIIVDNVSGSSQASNIYFTFLSNSTSGITCNGTQNVGCAVKLTQSALQ